MDHLFRSGLILLAGIALLGIAGAIHAIFLETTLWTALIAASGLGLSAWGAYALRADLGAMVRQRRGEIALYTLGVLGMLSALAYLSVLFPMRLDMTEEGRYSLSKQTVTMLKGLDKPVHITFFHDPMMRETVELYQLIARHTDKVTVEFYDPMLNPAQARLRGVQFAGTAIMESEDRKLQINGDKETDIANGVLRVSMGVQQTVCFLDGHREPDPFSLESHDHVEGAPGHSHGLGAQYVLHQQHGMAKARNALETMNYKVEKISLMRDAGADALSHCSLLVVAGPKLALLPVEVATIRAFLAAGGNVFFMLDPFVRTGLEPVLLEYGIVIDDDIVIDEASHFWADPSSPAVTDYNYHQIARDLPLTFFPGARSLSPASQRIPGVNVIPLANSSKQSFGETDSQRAGFDKGKDLPGPTTLMAVASRRPAAAEDPLYRSAQEGIAESARSLTKEGPRNAATGQSRIVVVGDSDFATNSFFHIMGNGNLFLNSVNYLAARQDLIGVEPRTYELPRVNLTNRQMKGTFFLSVVLIPALLAAVGFAVWWKQR
ncbi:MAG: GldG family protein [Burkholderiales bacterium]